MLLGIDEYPFHQIAQPFAATATSDAQWNDGHYFCVSDAEGKVCLAAKPERIISLESGAIL